MAAYLRGVSVAAGAGDTRRGMVPILSLLIALVLLCSAGQAQTSLQTSSIGGTVHDPSGLAVAGAKVHLLNVQRGTKRNTVTNNDGSYSFPGLQPGLYTVTAEQTGFETSSVKDVQVIIDQHARVDIVLRLGAVSQSVVVNAGGATPMLDTASNSLGTVMDSARVENLPLNGRHFMQLAQLVGGAQQPTGGSDMVASQTGRSSLTISVTGANQFQTTYLVDGIATRGARIGDSSLNLSVAAIDQFKIQLGFFLPDDGPNAGIINIITKSGTNHLHGEAYDFVRNTDLNGRNFFAAKPSNLQRNQFGISVGGPVMIPKIVDGRNRLFFFANYEGVRQISNGVANGYAPTQAMLGGDFSAEASTMKIYDPFSYDPATGQRTQFANNTIPGSLISPISQKLLAYYLPGSDLNTKPNNLTAFPRDTENDDQFTIRSDAAISQRQSLSVTFSNEIGNVINKSLMPLAGSSFPIHSSLAAVQDTFTISPHMVNIGRLGFNRAAVERESEAQSGPAIETEIGIPGTVDPNGIPGVSLQGFSGFGNASGPVGNVDDNYQVNDALNWSVGSHNLAFGAGIIYHRTAQNNANANAVGTLSFQPVFSAQLAPGANGPTPVGGTGSSIADFLLGMPLTGQVVGFPTMHYRFTEYYPYFQDSWRVTPNLTLNYGISWYYSSVPNPHGSDAKIPHAFNFSTGLLEYAALGQISPKVFHGDFNNFTPRLGFAWQPSFLRHTVVRAGAGIYYSQQGMIEGQFTAVAPPFQNPVSFNNSQFSPMPTYFFGNTDAITNVFPVIPLPPFDKNFAANLPNGFTPFAANPDNRVPYASQWDLSIQHTFGANNLLEADYIGNSAHDQQNRYDADQCEVSADLFCNTTVRPYPKYGYILYSNNNGNLSYNGLILKYEHQFSSGLTILANYTLSKTLSDSWETGTSTVNQIASCRSCDKGPPSYDVPQSLVVSTVYELPFGRGRRFGNNLPRAVDLIAGGWRWSTIESFSSGSAFSVTAPNRTGSPFTLVRADRLCNGKSDHFSSHLRTNGFFDFDTSCFAAPAAGHFGDSARGVLFGPGSQTWDMSFAKQFPIYESLKVEFQGDFFNIWNHANFGMPGAGVAGANFGQVTSAGDPRLIQLAGRIVW